MKSHASIGCNDAFKTRLAQVESVDEDDDYAHGIAIRDVIVEAL